LSEAGYIEDQDVTIEFSRANGRYDELPALAADLLKRKIAVLVAVGGEPAALAAKVAYRSLAMARRMTAS
jgi:putative ABC transport system substrate-binding protein